MRDWFPHRDKSVNTGALSPQGLPVYVNDLMCVTVVPRKELQPKRWHQGQVDIHQYPYKRYCYARRVQKKWIKKYGTREVRTSCLLYIDGKPVVVMDSKTFQEMLKKTNQGARK